MECCVYVKNIFWRCIKTFFGDASVSAFLLCVYVEYILIFLVMRWSVAFTLKTSFGDALVCAFLLCVDVENVLIFLVMRLAWNVTRLYLNWYHMATIHDLTNVFQTIFGYFFKGTCMIYLNNYHYVANTFRPFLQVNREMLLNVTYKSQKWIKLLLEKKRRKKVSVADKLRFLKKS